VVLLQPSSFGFIYELDSIQYWQTMVCTGKKALAC